MVDIVPNPPYATFINTFRCEPANQDEVVRLNIEIVQRVARSSAGFISASIHRSTDGRRVVNYLQWESAEHLAAMQRSRKFHDIPREFTRPDRIDPHECEVVHVEDRRAR